MPANGNSTAPMIGRADELDALLRALSALRSGRGACVLVQGEAGVGKSRLIAEAKRQADAEAFLTIQGACFEHDSGYAYAPIVDALRAHFAQTTPAQLRAHMGAFATEIVKLLPELALVLDDVEPNQVLSQDAEKRRLFEALAHFFIRHSVAQPLVLILEDLHWSDDVSLELLQLCVRRLAAHPVLVLATFRPDEAKPRLTHLLTELRRERLATDLTLAPLSRANSARLLRAILHSPTPVRADLLDRLFALSEGNPFLLEELVKPLTAHREQFHADGRWHYDTVDDLPIPRSVVASVQQRLNQLDETERELLTLAAVAGRRFDFALLQRATGRTEAHLLRGIKQLIAAQLVREESADQFAFRHALTREAVYASLLHRERHALHRRIADALGHVRAGDLDAGAADLAYHYHAARMWEKALHYASRAGAAAQALHAPHAAIEQFNRALDAAHQLGTVPPTQLLTARGKAYQTAGYFAPARDDYEHALHIAQESHDSAAEWEALIDLGRLWASRDYRRTGEYFQHALEVARRLGDTARIGHSLNRLGNWCANVAQPGEAVAYHHEALEHFERLQDRRGVVETLDLTGMASQLNGDLRVARAAYERAIGLWRDSSAPIGLSASLASVPLCAATYFHEADVPATPLRAAIVAGEEGARIARDVGWRAGEAYALFNLGMCLGPLGDYTRALDVTRLAHECAEEIEHRQWLTASLTVLGRLHLDLLDLDAARSLLEQALASATAIRSRIWIDASAAMLASACVEQRDFTRARELLATASADAAMESQGERLWWCTRAELEIAQEHYHRALHIADALIASARNATPATIVPRLAMLRAAALHGLGAARDAVNILEATRREAADQDCARLLWRSDLLLAKAWRSLGSHRNADAAFASARVAIDTIAAALTDNALRDRFAANAHALLPRPRSRSRGQAEKDRFGGLTAREREVAALIAQGLSNRDIARAQGVGVRTIEVHVTHILMKLGFTSRTQVVGWAIASGLSTSPPAS